MRSFSAVAKVLLSSLGLLGSLGLPACSSDPAPAGGSGGASGGECVPTDAVCFGAQGPSGAGHECLAKADNTGQTRWTGRFSQITVKAPASLAASFVQETIIDKGVFLNQPTCSPPGQGTFSWIFELDSTTNKLKTGGGKPIADPADGTCFVRIPTAQIPVAPITLDATITGDEFRATGFDVVVPIFLTATDLTSPILLPLHGGDVSARFSTDHNCIGKYNGDLFDVANACLPDTKAEPPQTTWTNGGDLSAYITIAEADQVFIKDLKMTLCVQLAGATDWGDVKDANGFAACNLSTKWQTGARPDGDWCGSVTPGDAGTAASATCKDAYHLKASFAASAFKVDAADCTL